MSSKISTWTWKGSNPGYQLLTVGGVTTDSQTIVPSLITRIDFSTTDADGISRLEELKSITQDSIISIIPDQGVEAGNNWTLRVSGEPTFETDPVPFYKFPVTTVSSTAGNGFGVTVGAGIALYAPTQANSFNRVEYVQDNLLTTWDASSFPSKSDSWDTREGNIRKEIYKMTLAKHNISFIYRESLRSMIASFNDVGYIDSEQKFNDIKCIHANAERAVAKLTQENNIILPIISIGQTTSDNDTSRQRTESLLINEKYWDAEKNRAFRVLSLVPRAVNIKYQVNIWTKYMSDMDQILEQIRLKFHPEMQVPTEFSTLAKAYLDSEEDVGQIAVADKEDRVLKKTLNMVLRTYIPSPKFLYTSTGKIEEFKVETNKC